jgi:Domain of unknown function (DUF932)
VNAQRTFRFRHTGNLQAKFAEARHVLGMTINYQARFKEFADRLALQPISQRTLERSVLRHLWVIDEDTGKLARTNRERAIERVVTIFRGRGSAGDTTGNSPGTKWVAFNAIAEHLDYGRRYTPRTDQVQRSFEDTALKQCALDLVSASWTAASSSGVVGSSSSGASSSSRVRGSLRWSSSRSVSAASSSVSCSTRSRSCSLAVIAAEW